LRLTVSDWYWDSSSPSLKYGVASARASTEDSARLTTMPFSRIVVSSSSWRSSSAARNCS
jgi:hypothetical protein